MPTYKKAKVEVDRLIPLVSSKVVSDVQLKNCKKPIMQSLLQQQSRQKASLGNARINAGFTTITAPVSGYIGRIPNKKRKPYFQNRS